MHATNEVDLHGVSFNEMSFGARGNVIEYEPNP